MPKRRRVVTLAAAICAAVLVSACDSTDPVVIVKHLYFSQDGNANGLYELDMTTGVATLVGAGITATTSSTLGLTETADTTLLIGSTWSDIAEINTDGSGANVLAGSVGVEALGMNTQTGTLYGAINGQFFTVNPVDGMNSGALAAPGADIEGLAVDHVNGVVYGLSRGDQLLYVYDIGGDSWSTVGSTGMDWLDTGLAYDRYDDVLYAIDGNTDSLYQIDPTTAATTLVGALGVEANGGLGLVTYEQR